MTPKEKAGDLYDKFFNSKSEILDITKLHREAIRCALIAVDEIISAIGFSVNDEYYMEVKQEIHKI
jgi:hypothetical protein